MDNPDHIALTLPSSTIVSITGLEDTPQSSTTFSRKSLRRSWNRLPRCQRNLIFLLLMAFCVIFFFVLPGDQLITKNKDSSLNKANYGGGEEDPIPFPGIRENHLFPVQKNFRKKISPDDQAAAIEKESQNLKHFKNMVKSTNKLFKFPEGDDIKLNESVNLPLDKSTRQGNIYDVHIENKVNFSTKKTNNDIEWRSTVLESANHINLEDVIREPKELAGVSIREYIKQKQILMPVKQHFHGATNERQAAVVAAFKHSWAGYKKYAWGHDNLKPISQTSHEWFGLGLTIVDALDTMYIMGLEDEFKEARGWVENKLTFNTSRDVNLFEVTIRVLGGLLAAYHLSGDEIFLIRSVELGNRLLPSFQSPSGIPYSDVNLGDMSAHSPKWSPDSSTSEVTTIQLEFRDLTRCINVSIYEKMVSNVNEKVHTLEKKHGLVPIFINANTGTFRNYATISLGARGDSYYEYLLKQWLQTGRKDNDFLIMDYLQGIDGVLTQLMRRTPKEHYVYIGELINGKDFKPKMDHLTCYLPGTLLLGHHNGMPDSHYLLATDLLETCFQTYVRQATKLAPEISYFAINENEDQDIYVKPNDAHNLLRPEFIETLYYFYALTGDRKYQDMGWVIFEAFEKHTKVAAGYTSIGNVKSTLNTRLRDMMESFWLGETLKYFYLLFSDNRKEIDLDKWIFNSEGHLLPIS